MWWQPTGPPQPVAHPIVLSITTLCGKGCPGNCAANNNSCLSPWELLTAGKCADDSNRPHSPKARARPTSQKGKCALNNNPAGVYA